MSRQLSTIAAHGTYGTPGARNPAGWSAPSRPGATAAPTGAVAQCAASGASRPPRRGAAALAARHAADQSRPSSAGPRRPSTARTRRRRRAPGAPRAAARRRRRGTRRARAAAAVAARLRRRRRRRRGAQGVVVGVRAAGRAAARVVGARAAAAHEHERRVGEVEAEQHAERDRVPQKAPRHAERERRRRPPRPPRAGVPFASRAASARGSTPSRAISASRSGCGRKQTSTTSGSSATSPTAVIQRAACQPRAAKPASNEVEPMPSSHGTSAQAELRGHRGAAAPASVPAIARGIARAGSRARAARQHTSSKPMKPKKSRLAPAIAPPAPRAKNGGAARPPPPPAASAGGGALALAAKPPTMRKATSAHLAARRVHDALAEPGAREHDGRARGLEQRGRVVEVQVVGLAAARARAPPRAAARREARVVGAQPRARRGPEQLAELGAHARARRRAREAVLEREARGADDRGPSRARRGQYAQHEPLVGTRVRAPCSSSRTRGRPPRRAASSARPTRPGRASPVSTKTPEPMVPPIPMPSRSHSPSAASASAGAAAASAATERARLCGDLRRASAARRAQPAAERRRGRVRAVQRGGGRVGTAAGGYSGRASPSRTTRRWRLALSRPHEPAEGAGAGKICLVRDATPVEVNCALRAARAVRAGLQARPLAHRAGRRPTGRSPMARHRCCRDGRGRARQPRPPALAADEVVPVYFGQGCFGTCSTSSSSTSARCSTATARAQRARYAGGKALDKNRVCYHNMRSVADYGKLGHTEVVGLQVPAGRVGDFADRYFDLFVKCENVPASARCSTQRPGRPRRRVPQRDRDPGRDEVAAFSRVEEANAGRFKLVAGLGNEPDTFTKNTVTCTIRRTSRSHGRNLPPVPQRFQGPALPGGVQRAEGQDGRERPADGDGLPEGRRVSRARSEKSRRPAACGGGVRWRRVRRADRQRGGAELAPVFDREELPPEELAARRVQREVARVRVGEHGRVRGRERVARLDLAPLEARVAAVVVGERADPREPVREHAARRVPLVGEPDDAAPEPPRRGRDVVRRLRRRRRGAVARDRQLRRRRALAAVRLGPRRRGRLGAAARAVGVARERAAPLCRARRRRASCTRGVAEALVAEGRPRRAAELGDEPRPLVERQLVDAPLGVRVRALVVREMARSIGSRSITKQPTPRASSSSSSRAAAASPPPPSATARRAAAGSAHPGGARHTPHWKWPASTASRARRSRGTALASNARQRRSRCGPERPASQHGT